MGEFRRHSEEGCETSPNAHFNCKKIRGKVKWADSKHKTTNSRNAPSILSVEPQVEKSYGKCFQNTPCKLGFHESIVLTDDSEPILKGGIAPNCYTGAVGFPSCTSFKESDHMIFFCDWYPKLFGIDEDEIPSSEDEEGLFDLDWEDIEEKAAALTPSMLDMLRHGARACMSDDDLREAWKRDQVPKYGRRARQKPILERKNHEKFECICDIDESYSRHYIPRYGGGVEREGEELRVPHFRAFWEEFKERADMADLDQSSSIFDQPKPEVIKEKKGLERIIEPYPSAIPKHMKMFRQRLLSTFRPLNCREVRRYRMPYAEALYLELQEDLYLNAAEFFKYLIVKDHFINERNPVRLRSNKPIINKTVGFLKLAEKLSQRKEYHKEAIILLKSGKYFNDHDENWWWLAEEFYVRAVKVSKNSVIDGGKSEAIANYILGTFFLDCVHRIQPAQEHLLKARELSLGKDWNAGRILNKAQDPIYQECSNYLCRALIAVSKELRLAGKPEEALPLIHRSHKLCLESKNPKRNIEMETYFELGMTYQEVGMLDWAKVAFRKYIEIAKLENYDRSICDGYLEMAICFRSEGDMNRCYYYLLTYLNTAEARKNKNLIAFAHRYLGEFCLNNGDSKAAVEHFDKAFKSFLEQTEEARQIPFKDWQPEHFTLPQDTELSRALYGLAQGEVVTRGIFYLILNAKTPKNQREIQLLINWKNSNQETAAFICEEILKEAAQGDSGGQLKDNDSDAQIMFDIEDRARDGDMAEQDIQEGIGYD